MKPGESRTSKTRPRVDMSVDPHDPPYHLGQSRAIYLVNGPDSSQLHLLDDDVLRALPKHPPAHLAQRRADRVLVRLPPAEVIVAK